MIPLYLLLGVAVWAADATVPLPSNLHGEGLPSIPASLLERLAQYGEYRAASFEGWHPDRREVLITTRFGNTAQLHGVAMPLGARQQLTFRRDRVLSGIYRPRHANQILYQGDVGGAEWYQFYLLDRVTGKTTMLTDGASRNGSPKFSRDGRWLAFVSTKRNRRDTDIYLMDPDKPDSTRMLMQADRSGSMIVEDWTPDGKWLAVQEYRSIQRSEVFLLEVATGKRVPLGKSSEGATGLARFSPDGKRLYLTMDAGSEFLRLVALDLAAKNGTYLPDQSRWDVEEVAVSDDGEHVAYVLNEDGSSSLHVADGELKHSERIATPPGVIANLHWRAGTKELGFDLASAKNPADVFSVDLSKGDTLVRWTEGETGGINPGVFRDAELVRWKSFDGRIISGFLYRPPSTFAGPRPVIVNIHGGPEGQSRPNFLGRVNYWVQELGIAVIYPNVRGSVGYGKEYVSLDNGMKREDSVKDIGTLLDWIASQKDLDAARVMVTGGSYGGYMTLASMTHFNDRLRCGLDVVGIANWVTFLENTEAYRRDLRRAEYGDERDPKMRDFLSTISPVAKVNRITKPMFIVQGKNDPRVPYTESEQMVQALRRNGTPTWYLLADDEGHGFAKKSNQDMQHAAAVLFIQKHLLE